LVLLFITYSEKSKAGKIQVKNIPQNQTSRRILTLKKGCSGLRMDNTEGLVEEVDICVDVDVDSLC
jgi:hypothetical protein